MHCPGLVLYFTLIAESYGTYEEEAMDSFKMLATCIAIISGGGGGGGGGRGETAGLSCMAGTT